MAAEGAAHEGGGCAEGGAQRVSGVGGGGEVGAGAAKGGCGRVGRRRRRHGGGAAEGCQVRPGMGAAEGRGGGRRGRRRAELADGEGGGGRGRLFMQILHKPPATTQPSSPKPNPWANEQLSGAAPMHQRVRAVYFRADFIRLFSIKSNPEILENPLNRIEKIVSRSKKIMRAGMRIRSTA